MDRSSENILIVDDEPENIRLLGQLLAARGYQIHVAESGEQALTAFETLSREVRLDLILLDVLMPNGLDGIETCRRLKQQDSTRTLPVIFLTAKEDHATIVRAFEAGGADYVLKPFETDVLLARVRAHLTLGRLSHDLESALDERSRQLRVANRELRRANDRLRRLAMEVSLIEEREKRRLAGELHDSPMQKLNLAQMQIASAARCRDSESDRLLEVGQELMREALQELRTLQFELSPPVLYQGGLGAALGWFARYKTKRFGVELHYVESPTLPAIETDLAVVLFQSARELVYNLIKHSGASRGRIELGGDLESICVSVDDDGRGFAPVALDGLTSGEGGYGLFGVRERLSLWGGELDIETKAQGARVTIRVPSTMRTGR
ncbi:response regulator [Thiorhodococcus mannitoliphagus]|uniref:Response regulator n=1 Tax=Thiorhodococcus mannitoliphagus TaxID=329406 RepID=A0A6P1DT77_9GAMM|nr:response regulator [Thiorhodococcus mannitoliphagus]NEX21318.1 response regulator [Thiorhodococcus mannitoliphagus]